MSVDLVALGDLHEPYASKRGKARAIEFVGDTKPKQVVQVGDLFDQLSASRHPHSRNTHTPEEEMNQARSNAVAFWDAIHRASPKSKLYQISGNHDGRVMKRVLETLPEVEHLVRPALRDLYTFAHVQTTHSEWDELILGDIVIQHGFRKFGEHVKWNNANTIHGHDHVGNIVWKATKGGALWEMSCGFLGEIDSPAFGYRSQKQIHNWTLGIGVVDNFGPRFVSFDK